MSTLTQGLATPGSARTSPQFRMESIRMHDWKALQKTDWIQGGRRDGLPSVIRRFLTKAGRSGPSSFHDIRRRQRRYGGVFCDTPGSSPNISDSENPNRNPGLPCGMHIEDHNTWGIQHRRSADGVLPVSEVSRRSDSAQSRSIPPAHLRMFSSIRRRTWETAASHACDGFLQSVPIHQVRHRRSRAAVR